MILAPLYEQRRVSFSSTYVRDDGSDDEDVGYGDSRLGEAMGHAHPHPHPHAFVEMDVVEVRFIPPLAEYSSKDKHGLWYSPREIRAMRQAAFRDIDRRKEEMKYNSKKRGKHGAYTCDIRGLERLVYDGDNLHCLKKRYECLRSILLEQHHQRIGRKANLENDERIRRVCMATGDTVRSQEKARALAREDEADVREYLQQQQADAPREAAPREESERDSFSPDSSDTQQQQHQHQQQPQRHHHQHQRVILSPMMGRNRARTASRDHCCWCVEVAEMVGRSLLLNSLLQPFLELHQTDAFLQVEPAAFD